MISKDIVVKISNEVEARPVAVIVQIASQFDSKINLISKEKTINAKSIMGMMSLGLYEGTNITIEADGNDENEAIDAIVEYIGSLA